MSMKAMCIIFGSLLMAVSSGEAALNTNMFAWLPAGLTAGTNASLRVERQFAPSGSKWAVGLDEQRVFHAALSCLTGQWRLGIGRGGQIYSLRGPFGEAIPPQFHRDSEWNDEVWQLVAVNSAFQRDARTSGWPYFIHGSGTYRKDPQYDSTFYAPIVAEEYDPASQSYTVMTWGQQAHVPTPHQSGVFFTTRWHVVDEMTIEVTWGVHNWGTEELNFFNVPWGGVRATTFPVRQVVKRDGTLMDQAGSFPTPTNGLPLAETGGCLLFANGDGTNAPSLALVMGCDRAPWPGAQILWRGGYAGNPAHPNPRDYFVTEIILHGRVAPGESFWARRFLVIGPHAAAVARARQLVDSASVTLCKWDRRTAPRIDSTHWSVPVPGSVPLFRVSRSSETGPELTTDPYRYATKQKVPNPLPAQHPRYSMYQDLSLVRPYAAGNTSWQFLGFQSAVKP